MKAGAWLLLALCVYVAHSEVLLANELSVEVWFWVYPLLQILISILSSASSTATFSSETFPLCCGA
jgi:hypothetical protein